MYWHMDYAAQAFQESGMRAVLSKSPLMFKDMSVDLAGCADYYNKWHNTADERLKVYLKFIQPIFIIQSYCRKQQELLR